MSSAMKVGEANFEQEVLQSSIPVIVDFWADWCQPCKQIAPIIDQIAAENDGKVKVVKVNVDDERTLSLKYGIMSIPTLLFFKGGDVKDKVVGFTNASTILDKLNKLV